MLVSATLVSASLEGANFLGANLTNADLTDAVLEGVLFSDTDLRRANLTRAKFTESGLGLRPANPEAARSLDETILVGAKGLTAEQIAACRARGANL